MEKEELIKQLKSHSGSSAQDIVKVEMIGRLEDSIEEFSRTSSKQTKWIIGLTIAMLIGAGVQIGLLIFQILTQ